MLNLFCAKMGLVSSSLGKGLPMKRIMDSAMDQLFHKLVHKEIINFEEFHMEILDMFSTLNAALPGKHYDMPSREEVEVRSNALSLLPLLTLLDLAKLTRQNVGTYPEPKTQNIAT